MSLYIPQFTVLCPVFLPACHTTGFAWVPLYDYTKLHICRLVQCITVSYWASVGTVLCAPRFLLCISLYASFFVTCSVSCTFCVYVLCAPSHLSPRIPFLYTVVWHTLSVCRFYASPTSGEAYRDRRLTTNLELWVEIFCVPTCFHVRIPKPCLCLSVCPSVCPSVCLSICPYPEKRNHHSFVNISPTLVIDTSMERSSRVLLHHGTQKFDLSFKKVRNSNFDFWRRAEITLASSISVLH